MVNVIFGGPCGNCLHCVMCHPLESKQKIWITFLSCLCLGVFFGIQKHPLLYFPHLTLMSVFIKITSILCKFLVCIYVIIIVSPPPPSPIALTVDFMHLRSLCGVFFNMEHKWQSPSGISSDHSSPFFSLQISKTLLKFQEVASLYLYISADDEDGKPILSGCKNRRLFLISLYFYELWWQLQSSSSSTPFLSGVRISRGPTYLARTFRQGFLPLSVLSPSWWPSFKQVPRWDTLWVLLFPDTLTFIRVSQAHGELSGEDEETNVHVLMDPDRTSRCRLSLASPLRCADKAMELSDSTLPL